MDVFYSRHVCRISPIPEFVQRTFDKRGFVYNYINGPSEFHVVGVIKDWDRTDHLSEIHIPTLILSGRYDESTPLINEVIHRSIAGSEWIIFENSSHLSHVEVPELYMQTVRAFLDRVESVRTGFA